MSPLTIGFLVFATLLVASLALVMRTPQREVIGLRLREIELQRTPREMTLALPFHRRALLPFIESAGRVIIQVVPPKSIAKVRSNLTKAGRRYSDPLLWILMKWLGAALLGGGVYGIGGLRGWPPVVQAVGAIGCAGFAYLWPEWSIRRAIQRRQAQIIKELPETLDLLTISVEAGLGLDQALETVSKRRSGPLSEEVRIYLDEVRLGGARKEGLKAIGTRTGVEDLITFTATLVQAMEFGVSIAHILRTQADEVRVRRRMRVEERAMKAPVKLLFPLIFLILPALFVVVAGPGLIRAYTEFINPSRPGTLAPPPALNR